MTASDAAAPQATPPDPSALKAAGAGDPSVGIERAVAELQEAMLARRQVVEDLHATSPKRREQASVRHERELQRIRELMQQTVAAAHARHDSLANEAMQRRDSVIAESQIEFDADFERVKSFHQEEYTRLKRKLEETVLMAEAWREAGEEAERAKAREFQERMKRFGEEGDEIERQAAEFLEDSGLRAPKFVAVAQSGSSGKPAEVELLQALTSAREALDVIRSGRSSRLLNGVAPYALGAAIVVGAGVIGGATTLLHNKPWLMSAGVSAGGSLVFVAAALVVLKVTAHRSLRSTWAPFQAAIGAFRSAHARALSEDESKREERLRKLRDREAEQEAEAHANLDGPIAEVPKARERHEKKIRSKHERNVTRAREECDAAIKDSATQRDADIAQAIAGAESALKNEKARFTAEIGVLDAETIRALAEARTCWIRSATRSRELLIAASELDRATQPPLEQLAVENCVAARRADWFRFGTLRLEPATQPGGVPSEPEFAVDLPDAFEFPACLGFPRKGNLIIETTPQTRGAALRIVQAAVTRIVTSIPPSKVRFTFIDPVALGESFASFMHLGDEFEHLVGERIWTEPRAIEQRLQDVSEHMETVIQKYLRNEFEDIDAYNTAAGEIAEPYRFVVCSDFPAAFSDQASARLVSLLRAGQRCGVHVILMLDRAAQLPTGVTREELMSGAAVLAPSRERPGSFEFASGPFAKLPLRLDAPVPDDRLLPILTQIGRAARDASRVEVPFDMIAPSGDAFWSLSSATGLRVPIGRAGATRLQQFALGSGTSQHALIAGKTGSGKSTLLHAIITGLACWYSPAEVELWLVDFKKGVEFKTYAENALPHARAVAIESDREFGLSVLEGLDAELARRGELFREAGVQDIASFRRARPDVRMPRVLLVIDEFQEFFLDDDRVAQSASMLLDRLVRQGRAFGMHALLGSQTLGGAYSLARSTMGQMGVRIALQCNEADSQLILSDENLAARLLSRPGEAIYNDAGGRVEGNSPFQVAFLPDEKRDSWLENVAGRASGRFDSLPRIVFEGDARAPMKLSPAARGGVAPDPRGSVRLWVGEAVAIKDPTCARLARTSGANVATISSRDDQSLGTSIAMLLSIAREAPGATIDVFDGTPADVPEYGRLAQVAESNGIAVRFTPYREIDQRLLEIADDVASRGDDSSRPRRFLLIHQIQRYRALRRSEDDFSFGASDAPPGPDKLLVGIIKEGPAAGVHVIVACDSLASLQRSFDRTTLREFDWKVLFQMSPSDSSTIIDSPAASRLGNNRGLLHSEELGMVEKFRPYV